MYGLEEPRLRRSAGGLLKESPKPPRTFLECMDWRSRGSCLLPGKNSTGCADTVSAVSGIRLPPECRFCWDCKRRKRFNAGVPGAKPPAKLTYGHPPFPLGRGRGDGGRKEREGSVSRRQRKHALHGGTCTAGTTSAARVQPRGCKGRSPLHKNNLDLPLPRWGRGRGDGGRKEREGGVGRRQRKHAPTGARVWQGQPAPQAV